MKILVLPLVLILALLFALPTIDPDFGWFYRCGKMAISGASCSQNTFSVLLPNYHWTRPMMLYPSLIAIIFGRFSFWGLTFLNIFFGLFTFFFFHKTLKTPPTLSAIAFIFSTLLSFSALSLGLRNQSLSLLFFLSTIYLLLNKKLLFLFFNFFLWANFHPSSPIGLAIVGFYAITHPAGAAAGGIIAGLATLLNPFGLKIYDDILAHLQTPLNMQIAEWVPPNISQQILIISLTLFYLLFSFLKKKVSLFYSLAMIFTAVLSLSARRNLLFFYFLFPIAFLKSIPEVPLSFLKTPLLTILLPLVTIVTAIIILPKTIDINTNWNSYCHKGITNFPCEAIEFLKKEPPGNIFNTYEWGGFLIWQLPEFKVFIDGRMPAWRLVPSKVLSGPVPSVVEGVEGVEGPAVSPYSIYLATYQTQPGWRKTLEDYKIDYILISPGTFLDLELKKNIYPWKEIFKSQYSIIYARIR